jgi:hypothetical protein
MSGRHAFYPVSRPAPLDQADGLRRLFAGQGAREMQVMALVANPHLPFGGLAVDRVVNALTAMGHHVLVVDAASGSPQPHELAQVDMAACIERIAPQAHYLCARGLPMSYVDTRGSTSSFVHAVQAAALQVAPKTDMVVLHADASELARLFKTHPAAAQLRPLLLGSDDSESIKHAYAAAKLLATRNELLSFDLLLVSAPHASRLNSIATSLGDCIENFLGGVLCHTAVIDPASDFVAEVDADLLRLMKAQLHGLAQPHAAVALSQGYGMAAVAAHQRAHQQAHQRAHQQAHQQAHRASSSVSSTAFR